MTVFWSLAALLVIVALVFVVPPLLRRPRRSGVRNDELNVQVIRDQLAELRTDLETGRLDQAAYEAARRDLQRELLEDVDAGASPEAGADEAPRGRWLAAVLGVLVPLLAVVLYQQIGALEVAERIAAGPSAAPAASADGRPSLETMIARLAERMQQEPENVEGWILLGRSYASMNRYAEAAAAYREALKRDKGNAELLSSYADTLVMAHNGEFTDEVGKLLDQALAIDPRHAKSHWLRGHWRFRRGDFRGAIEDWEAVVQVLPPADENVAIIKRQINAARQRLGEPVEEIVAAAAPPASAPAAAAGGGGAIQVQVTLDPALRDKASDNDTVFIFARAVQGPRMPLAIVRKRVADLPVTVTLDDSMAMSPAMVLSKFGEVVVGARVSKSGQAMPASGDLQGMVSPVAPGGDADVKVTIDTVVP